MRISSFLLTSLALTAVLAAQTQPGIVWHPDNSTVGGGNAFPWGSEGIRYQTIVANAQLPARPVVIRDVFVALPANSTYADTEIVYGDIEIRMGITQQLQATGNWTTNNPNPATVYRGPLRVAFKKGQWTGIGLPTPYLFLPLSAADNLCFEVIIWQVRARGSGATSQTTPNFYYPLAGGNVNRAFLYQWVQNGGHGNPGVPLRDSGGNKLGLLIDDGNVVVLGDKGCNSSAPQPSRLSIGVPAGTWPKQGAQLTLTLSGALPNSPAFLCLGSNDQSFGALTLPFDLGALQAPGCMLWTDILLTVGAPVLGNGTATVPLALPAATAGLWFTATWVGFDAQANALGLVTSDYAKLLVGS